MATQMEQQFANGSTESPSYPQQQPRNAPTALPTIPGERIQDRRRLAELREHVANILGVEGNPARFPGAQPISFGSKHIDELCRENYFVSEKADGIRCLMFTTQVGGKGETYLIDRKNEYYWLDFGLPSREGGVNRLLVDTVLDGELVYETKKDRHGEDRTILLFLFFDAMVFDGKNICDRPYSGRLGYLREYIVKPIQKLMTHDPQYASRFPFRMIQKRLELAYKLNIVFDHMQGYHHKTDGVIFTSEASPYRFGTSDKMLKWKPSDENTVDFKVLQVVREGRATKYEIGIMIRGNEHQSMGLLTIDPEHAESWRLNPPVGCIIECRYDPSWPGCWRFSRFRDDKATANHISTYNSIMDSIQDNVEKEDLLGVVSEIERSWKSRSQYGRSAY